MPCDSAIHTARPPNRYIRGSRQIAASSNCRRCPFDQTFSVAKGVRAKFTRAGHIVGSACLAFDIDGTRLTFSGDVGRPVDPIMKPPEPLSETDYLVLESTYGDRRNPEEYANELVASIVNRTAEQGGVVVIPAFAVGRAQHLLHILDVLKRSRKILICRYFWTAPWRLMHRWYFARMVRRESAATASSGDFT